MKYLKYTIYLLSFLFIFLGFVNNVYPVAASKRHHSSKYFGLALTLLCFLIFIISATGAHAAWYNASWGYRKQHTINASAGAGTNYQVKITVHYGSGSDSAGNVYLSSHSRTDFADVVFTASNGTSTLDYWMESKTDSDNAVFWVEVAADLSTVNQDIYIYYGNSGQSSSGSNGANTFVFFDDFSGASLDTNKWLAYNNGGSLSTSESGGLLSVTANTTDPTKIIANVGGTGPTGTNLAMRAKLKVNTGSNADQRIGLSAKTTTADGKGYNYVLHNFAVLTHHQFLDDAIAWGTDEGGAWSKTTWYTEEVYFTSTTNIYGRFDDGTWYNWTGTTARSGYLALNVGGFSETVTNDWDFALVRKMITSEPAHSTWGGEETPATTTLGDGTDSAAAPTIGPGGSATEIDRFSLATNTGTDTVTGMTVTLGPANAYNNVATVDVQTTGGASKCSATPSSNTVLLTSCAISVTTSSTDYKIMVTPKIHSSMPAVPGASYATVTTVTSITATNTTAGSDTDSDTVTIDNLSPTSATVPLASTAGNTAVTLKWTSSASADISSSVILRWTAATPGADVPAEGSTYTADNTIGGATVACVISSAASTAYSKITGTGGDTGCSTTALSNGTQYSFKVFSEDSNGNYDAGTTINGSPLTPTAPGSVTEFVSVVDPGGTGDYSSLSAWEAATQTDLTSANTQVFAGTKNNTVADSATVYLCDSANSYRGESARVVHATATQILVDTITSAVTEASTDYWYSTNTCGSGTKYFTLSDGGNSAIAVATCRTTNGAADTTAVSISGWTTSTTNYIKIWTDPAEGYRHSGKWDDGKYHLNTTTSGAAIYILEENVRIDGLQIYYSYASGGYGIEFNCAGQTDIRISNNMLKGPNLGTSVGIYFFDGGASSVAEAWNNIIYDNSTGYGIRSYNNSSNITGYVYNNTIYNADIGINTNVINKIIAKNNILYNTATSYDGTFDATSTYNVTNQSAQVGAFGATADSGTTSSTTAGKLVEAGQNFLTTVKVGMIIKNTTDTTYTYVTNVDSDTTLSVANDIMPTGKAYTIYTNMYGSPTFEDSANNDFHLDSSDTVAKNKGANLYADANIAVTTDIDNNVRPNSATLFDIGADENIAKIYRSVGPSATAAITSGTANYHTNHLTISGIYATFELPLPDNVGVGDAIQYDSDNNGSVDAIAFIDKRFSSQKYRIKSASGAAPTAMAVADIDWSIFRSFTSLAKAESGDANADENDSIADAVENFDNWTAGQDLVTAQKIWNIAAYANGTTADTAAVTINGWTTSADSYINIFTPTRTDEVETSQRASGKWDATKYNLSVTGDDNTIYITEDYVRIDGLQISGAGSGSNDRNIYISATPSGTFYISNCIFTNTRGGADQSGLFVVGTDNFTMNVWNCLFYSFETENSEAIYVNSSLATLNVYNTTLSGNAVGIDNTGGGTVTIKNNLFDTCTLDAIGTIADTYCATTNDNSKGLTAAGTGNRFSQTFSFADASNHDFHLAPDDGGAKNYGVDLTNDLNLSFNTDIDSYGISDDTNKTRPYNTAWDIGADEVITPIYRSVAPEADGDLGALATGGSNAMTISGPTATFTTALPDNIGVGDVLQYDSNNNNAIGAGDTLAFITGRTDSTHYTVKQKDGTVPVARAGDTYWSIFRAYTSLSNAEAGTENLAIDSNLRNFDAGNRNLKTNSEQWNFAMYGNGTTADTTGPVDIDGWETAPQNYIRVYTPYLTNEVGTSQRHSGKWDNTKYRLVVNDDFNIYEREQYFRLDGIQLGVSGTITHNFSPFYWLGFTDTNNDVRISNCIIVGTSANTNSASYNWTGFGMTGTDYIQAKIWNTIIYGYPANWGSYDNIGAANSVVNIYSSTIITSESADIGIRREVGTLNMKNSYVAGGSISAYYGTITKTTCASDDTSGDIQNVALNTTNFTNVTSGQEDYHLPAGSTLKDVGADLSQDPVWQSMMASVGNADLRSLQGTDIDGSTRPLTGSGLSWDIGANEVATPIYRSNGPSATSALATGASNHLNISGSTATFDSALPDNVGVGDALEYDANNSGTITAIAFITGRTSSTVYTIKSVVGGTPTPQTAADEVHWNIFRSSTSLSNAEAGIENTGLTDTVQNFDDWTAGGNIGDDETGRDIWTNNEQWNISAYANGTTADTAAVTISGWTTAPTNYLKIYTPMATTEVGTSQRAQGKWDDSKYNLYRDTLGGSATVITLSISYVWIDGLQIKGACTGTSYPNIVAIGDLSADSNVKISNNIIQSDFSGLTTGYYGEIITDASWSAANNKKIWNNILYDITPTMKVNGTYFLSTNTTYFFNNTVANTNLGIQRAQGTVISKNNLSYNNTTDYSGTFDSSSTNNLSKDQTAPALNTYYRGATVKFVDEAGKDFHLDPTDIGARNMGADLSADTSLPITDDIDGKARPNQGAFDIGADEAAKGVYYSVGQNVTDHGSGGNLSIANGLATFSVAQTATNLGVGDKVTYNTSSIAYLLRKVDTTHWYLVTATGALPANVDVGNPQTVNTITHAYASLYDAEAGAPDSSHLNSSDLATNDYQLNIPCYNDAGAADETAVTVDGYTTGSNNFIKIYTPVDTATEANTRQRHWGKWDTNKYYLSVSNNHAFWIASDIDYIKVDGLQISVPSQNADNQDIFWNNSATLWLSNSILKGSNSNSYIQAGFRSWGTNYIWNSIFYNINNTFSSDNYSLRTDSLLTMYNSTVIGGYVGVFNGGAGGNTLKNVYAGGAGAGGDYYGFNKTTSASSDTTGTAGLQNIAVNTTNFTNVTSGQEDYHLPSGSALRNVGTNLSNDSVFSFSTDIDGNGRSLWDIGADEGSVEMEATVMQSGGDYSSLSSWQTGMVTDLVTPATMVFSGTRTSTIADNASLYLCRSSAYQNITATTVHSSATQLLAETISSPSFVMTANDVWYTNSTCNSSNYFTISTAGGDPAIAVAKIDGAWSSADTSAVTISGWETGPTNYVKVYTTTAARHNGKWDETKYRIEVSNTSGIYDYANYIRIDGVQVQLTSTLDTYNYGIAISPPSGSAEAWVSNSIVKGVFSSSANSKVGIAISGYSGQIAKVWNNIVYDFINGSNLTMWGFYNDSFTTYLYNNTVYNSYEGFHRQSGTVIAKNNISYNNADNYAGSFDASSTNNLSGPDADAQIPATNARDGVAVSFVNANEEDFHLSENDSGAKDQGADLSADTYLAFENDIDGDTRPIGPDWDIGADEESHAIPVYYSVGQNVTTHETGAGNVTVSGTTATFTVAQTATNMGVGDVVDYGAGNDECYISEKISTTVWSCVSATGGVPVDSGGAVVVNSIHHAFDSLSNAIAGADDLLGTSDLVSGNYALNIPCYNDAGAADTTAVTISGYTTGLENYIKIYTPNNTSTENNTSQRHSGKWDDGKYRLELSNSTAIWNFVEYVRFDGLQIKNTNSTSNDQFLLRLQPASAGEIQVSNSILQGHNHASYTQAAILTYDLNCVYKIWNNIIYNINTISNNDGIYFYQNANSYAYNNTIIGGENGIYTYTGNSITAKNNIVQSTTIGYSGTFNSTSGYNLSDHADAPGSNPRNSTTVSFVDATNKDFHLAFADTGAKGYGVNLMNDTYLAFSQDIDGQERTGNWSIGADEPREAEIQSNTQKVQSLTDGLVMYQSFDGQDINGTTAIDRSGNNNNGTITGATPTRGKLGQALSFDGMSNEITIPGINLANNSFTLSAWAKRTVSGTHDVILWQGTSGTDQGLQFGFLDSNNFYCRFWSDDLTTTDTYTDSNWHLWTCSYNASDKSRIIYRDGVLAKQDTAGANYQGSGTLYVGHSSVLDAVLGMPTWLNGSLDELRVYNRALSIDEVGDLYRLGQDTINSSQTDNNKSGLVGMWSFDGPDIDWGSNTAYDRSGSNNDGTISGATPTRGKKGQALSFDGSSSSVNLNSTTLIGVQTLTACAWINPKSAGGDGGAGTIIGNVDFIFGFNGNASIMRLTSNAGGSAAVSTAFTFLNNWSHVCVIRNSDGTATFYINGAQSGTANQDSGTPVSSAWSAAIGQRAGGLANWNWDGTIDEVRVYDRALSPDEVGDLYRLGTATMISRNVATPAWACGDTLQDVDSNTYGTVQIGTQCWMAENLRTTKKPNGDALTSYCNPSGCDSPWGRLYLWDVAMNGSAAATGTGAKIQGICPTDWHIPSDYNADANDDMQKLSTYLGGDSVSGGHLKQAGTTNWSSPNTGADNSSNFTGIPAGNWGSGNFYGRGNYLYFWSSSENNASWAWYRALSYYDALLYRLNGYKSDAGYSVRCVKD